MSIRILFFLVISITKGYSQKINYKAEFDNVLHSEYSVGYSYNRILAKAHRNNSHHFLEIGYFINANNILGNTEISFEIIQSLIKSAKKSNDGYYRWNAKINSNDRNYSQNGKEFMLFEGYLFRYIAEFMYYNQQLVFEDPQFIRNVFLKWYSHSIELHEDNSSFYGLRLHIGSHWATVAMYLTKLDPANISIYESYLNQYNKQLRESLNVVMYNNIECYVWNSTYISNPVNNIKNRNIKPQVQDVSHGNHIVQYVFDAYRLDIGGWTEKDLLRFLNTLKEVIWNDEKKPSDYVDGSYNHSNIKTGWKQSDGWMKLMLHFKNYALYEHYDSYYSNNKKKVNTHYPNIQYFAIMAKFDDLNKNK